MKACKNCKWWGKTYYRVCDFPNTIIGENPKTKFEVVCSASNNQRLEAKVFTGEDFYCLHFKEKSFENI